MMMLIIMVFEDDASILIDHSWGKNNPCEKNLSTCIPYDFKHLLGGKVEDFREVPMYVDIIQTFTRNDEKYRMMNIVAASTAR